MMRREQDRTWCLRSNLLAAAVALATMFALTVAATPSAQAQTYNVIYSFTEYQNGANPAAGLTMDRAGNLYGTTTAGSGNCSGGGDSGCGTVFKLSHKGSGWVFNPIYDFLGGNDGWFPTARVIFGRDGNLYGSTTWGGGNGGPFHWGFGTVFKLQPPPRACTTVLCPWNETQLYIFTGESDGDWPQIGDLVFDLAGNLYGTTVGQAFGNGSVYELSPSNGGWTINVLHSFAGGADGADSWSGVAFDKEGNIWGTTESGGISDCGQLGDSCGVLFELVPSGSGWTEKTVFQFHHTVGGTPAGNLIFDPSGNLFGTASSDGPGNGGTVYELTPGGTFSIVHAFSGNDGSSPYDSVVMDAAGNLYGTTYRGGAHGYGVVYKLTPSSGGWTYTDLHDFAGGSDGAYPASQLILDANGNLYGTTLEGGPPSWCNGGCGVIFEITP